jgi:hypothetical protein
VVHGRIIIPNDGEDSVNSFLAFGHLTADFKRVPFQQVRMVFRMPAALGIVVLLREQVLAKLIRALRTQALLNQRFSR